jgi:uncharacterized protein YjbI with pentapeptide repeats
VTYSTRMGKTTSLLKEYGLIGANLERADLRDMDLHGVNFTDATLRGADLSGSNLRGAIFAKADLSRACLYQCDCEGADFTAADMSMSYARGVNFSKCKFWNTTMRRMTAKNSYFYDADLADANVLHADFLGSFWNGAKLDGIRNVGMMPSPIFFWYMPDSYTGGVKYFPAEGYHRMNRSYMGGTSVQENAAARSK